METFFYFFRIEEDLSTTTTTTPLSMTMSFFVDDVLLFCFDFTIPLPIFFGTGLKERVALGISADSGAVSGFRGDAMFSSGIDVSNFFLSFSGEEEEEEEFAASFSFGIRVMGVLVFPIRVINPL